MPIADLRDLIIEEKACEIVNAWADAVVEELGFTVPVASGVLADAMLARSPAERVDEGWVVGIGSMERIGAGPFDAPPRGTISAFLAMWREEEGGAREVAAREKRARDFRSTILGRQKAREREALKAKQEREWWDKSYEAERENKRRTSETDRFLKAAKRKLADATDRAEDWEKRREDRSDTIRKRIGRNIAWRARVETLERPLPKFEETAAHARLVGQRETAERRRKSWEVKAEAQKGAVARLEKRVLNLTEWLRLELIRRRKRVSGR